MAVNVDSMYLTNSKRSTIGIILIRKNVLIPSFNEYPAGIYLLKVNNRNTRTRCEICSKLTIKTPERR